MDEASGDAAWYAVLRKASEKLNRTDLFSPERARLLNLLAGSVPKLLDRLAELPAARDELPDAVVMIDLLDAYRRHLPAPGEPLPPGHDAVRRLADQLYSEMASRPHQSICPGCGKPVFAEPGLPHQRYHDQRCRQRAYRLRKAGLHLEGEWRDRRLDTSPRNLPSHKDASAD